MKFFKDGMPSGNLLVAANHAQNSGNFFEQQLTNQLDSSKPKITDGSEEQFWRTAFGFQKFGEFSLETPS